MQTLEHGSIYGYADPDREGKLFLEDVATGEAGSFNIADWERERANGLTLTEFFNKYF